MSRSVTVRVVGGDARGIALSGDAVPADVPVERSEVRVSRPAGGG